MKTLRSLVRLHHVRLDERRRELVALESRRAKLEGDRALLEQQLLTEQQVAARSSEAGFAYGNYAQRVIQRRADIAAKINELDGEIAKAVVAVGEAFQEVKRYEVALENHQKRERVEEERRHQAALDEIALTMHRRRDRERT